MLGLWFFMLAVTVKVKVDRQTEGSSARNEIGAHMEPRVFVSVVANPLKTALEL